MRPFRTLPSILLVVAAIAGIVAPLRAALTLPKIFGDHMVLQQGQPVPVWGRAEPGQTITVEFAGQKKSTVAAADGTWRVALDALSSSSEPRELMISSGNPIENPKFQDVLVGEVWLCSGQSNMEMAVGAPAAGAAPESAHDPAVAQEIARGGWPAIRLFRVEKTRQPPDVVSNGWTAATGDPLARFSAAGFYFGRALHDALHVPIGLVESAWGGSRIEEWTPRPAYAALEKLLGTDAEHSFERNAGMIGRNYTAMVAPLAPFALRGVIWYQGESNIIPYNDGRRYADKFAVFVTSWRAAWQQPELPFYAVQLAPFIYSKRKDPLAHAEDELPKLWEAQQLATAIPHTGLVPITDTVEQLNNIHPGHKTIVGARLAALALAETYGRKDVPHAGPIVRRVECAGPKATVTFAAADDGLVTRDGAAPDSFEVAGPTGDFVPALATIRGQTVELTAEAVPMIARVRFGWHETARPNLANRAGWPAYPFRSDAPSWRPPQL